MGSSHQTVGPGSCMTFNMHLATCRHDCCCSAFLQHVVHIFAGFCAAHHYKPRLTTRLQPPARMIKRRPSNQLCPAKPFTKPYETFSTNSALRHMAHGCTTPEATDGAAPLSNPPFKPPYCPSQPVFRVVLEPIAMERLCRLRGGLRGAAREGAERAALPRDCAL